MAEDYESKAVWFLAGAAVGAAIALLYAPASGQDTRRRIRRSAEDASQAIRESGGEMMERGRELYDRGRKIADEAAEVFEKGRKLVQG
jgi:gas vesicle protein